LAGRIMQDLFQKKANCKSVSHTLVWLEKELTRKSRFWVGFLLLVVIYSLPFVGLLSVGAYLHVALTLACFVFSVYLLYRYTIRDIRPRYPIVSPEGHPDVYTGRMPRPIHEDMEQYPWFFRKKHARKLENKKAKKKH